MQIPSVRGNSDETHQQGWMISRVIQMHSQRFGVLAVGNYHDHSRFRLRCSPEVIPLEVTRPKDVVAALSKIYLKFGDVQEFRDWYSAYLANGA